MPAYVVSYKCVGCGDCVTACPQSIIHIDPGNRKAFNIEPDMCWECFPCVKVCDQKAVEIRGYSDFSPLGGQVTLDRDTKSNVITWFIRYKNGKEYKFTYPIRTTQWGSIKPAHEYAAPSAEALKTHLLLGEPSIFGLDHLPVPVRKTSKER